MEKKLALEEKALDPAGPPVILAVSARVASPLRTSLEPIISITSGFSGLG